MTHRLAQWFVVRALVAAVTAPWTVLQSAAWTGMAVQYSIKAGSLKNGLSKTFDGHHPCALCRAVSRGRMQEAAGLQAVSRLPWTLPATGGFLVVLTVVLTLRRPNQQAAPKPCICALSNHPD